MRLLLITMLATASASAAPSVDWAAGQLTADGIGLADRQAPTPAVARGTARRKAEDAARRALREAAPTLPLAGGGTLADKLGDAAVRERLDSAVAAALVVRAEPETDGAWTVTLALPLEAVRQALTGPRPAPPAGDAGPAVVVVEGVTVAPALGFTVGGLGAATVWVDKLPAWAASAPKLRASVTGADLAAPLGKATAATLFVIKR